MKVFCVSYAYRPEVGVDVDLRPFREPGTRVNIPNLTNQPRFQNNLLHCSCRESSCNASKNGQRLLVSDVRTIWTVYRAHHSKLRGIHATRRRRARALIDLEISLAKMMDDG